MEERKSTDSRQPVCDFVWSLLEPWDKDILAHDEQFHVLLEEYAKKIRQGALADVAQYDHVIAEYAGWEGDGDGDGED